MNILHQMNIVKELLITIGLRQDINNKNGYSVSVCICTYTDLYIYKEEKEKIET